TTVSANLMPASLGMSLMAPQGLQQGLHPTTTSFSYNAYALTHIGDTVGGSVSLTTTQVGSIYQPYIKVALAAGHPVSSLRWTGLGPDNLWSDGANWNLGTAPIAGTNLFFPSNSKQQTNVDDLGFTLGGVTFQGGNYNVSGQPLTVGNLEVQGG